VWSQGKELHGKKQQKFQVAGIVPGVYIFVWGYKQDLEECGRITVQELWSIIANAIEWITVNIGGDEIFSEGPKFLFLTQIWKDLLFYMAAHTIT
jgi:hypothetical protein